VGSTKLIKEKRETKVEETKHQKIAKLKIVRK
jgi:hypothetical protein